MNKRTGALIVAAGGRPEENKFRPLEQVGDSTVIRRIIITMKQAGIEPIVVVTGHQGDELEKHVAKLQVIFLRNKDYQKTQMFDSICMGLSYMQELCSRIFVLPAKFPMFLPLTVLRMMEEDAPVVCPVYRGKGGHPVLISSSLIPDIIAYKGDFGLQGALRELQARGVVKRISVEDTGILQSIDRFETELNAAAQKEEKIPIHPHLSLSLRRNDEFFGPSMAQFLVLINHTGSIRNACRQMHISYTKGWSMIREARQQLGFSILTTQSGGADGGFSQLTREARDFLERYLAMNHALKLQERKLFDTYFPEYRTALQTAVSPEPNQVSSTIKNETENSHETAF